MRKDNWLNMYLMLTGGAALGALTMYFVDPARGRHRRAACAERLTGAANRTKEAVESSARDLGNRARGVLAEAKSSVTKETAAAEEPAGAAKTAA